MPEPGSGMPSRTQIWLGCVAVAVLLLTIAVGAAAAWIWQQIHSPFQGYAGPEVAVDVPRGVGATEILQALEQAGVVSNARLTRLYLVYQLDDPALKAGEYRFVGPLSIPEVLDKLIRGEVVTHPVTIIEGLTLEETATHLAEVGVGGLERFLALMQSNELVADLDPEATDLEGYLFPETYHFARGTTETEIVGTMVETFRTKLENEVLAPITRDTAEQRSRPGHLGLDRREGSPFGRRETDHRRGLRQSTPPPHSASCRPYRDLRAQARGNLGRQFAPRRSRGRLALQHLSLSWFATWTHRLTRPG